jgi:hypothetical protein
MQKQLSLLLPGSETPCAPQVHRLNSKEEGAISGFIRDNDRDSALICGDAETVLSRMPDGVFQTCVTSPPYWSLRDYNIRGQIGLESSVFAYIDHLARVFSELRRVLQ